MAVNIQSFFWYKITMIKNVPYLETIDISCDYMKTFPLVFIIGNIFQVYCVYPKYHKIRNKNLPLPIFFVYNNRILHTEVELKFSV